MLNLLVQQFDENIKFKYCCWPETDPDFQNNTKPAAAVLNVKALRFKKKDTFSHHVRQIYIAFSC